MPLWQRIAWGEAAVVFHRLTAQLPAADSVAPYAAQLLLESLNVLATGSPPRPACQATLRSEAARARQRLCAPTPPGGLEDTCRSLERVERELNARPAP